MKQLFTLDQIEELAQAAEIDSYHYQHSDDYPENMFYDLRRQMEKGAEACKQLDRIKEILSDRRDDDY
jgi:hypothetical protein